MKASEYKKLAQSKEQNLINLELPSGAVFICRRPPVQQWVMAGKLPSTLASKLTTSAGSQQNIMENLEPGEMLKALAFGRDLMLHSVIEPKISLTPKNANEIAPEDILPEDFEFLLTWVMSGGETAASLENFRPSGREPASTVVYGDEVRPTPVKAAKTAR